MNQPKDPLGYDVYAQTLWARIRLPLVQRLLEHMQVERHAFNPFKWAKELATQLVEEQLSPEQIDN
jgi:hypothetical protein